MQVFDSCAKMDPKQLPTVRLFHVTKTERDERLDFPRATGQQPIASPDPGTRVSIEMEGVCGCAVPWDQERTREGS